MSKRRHRRRRKTAMNLDRLLAVSSPLTLPDGRTVQLRYSRRSAQRLQDRFGSLDAVGEALSDGTAAGQIDTMVAVLAAGLLHEDGITDDDLEGLTPAQLRQCQLTVQKALAGALQGR